MNEINKPSQLIVIGNGFDLTAGLNSTYAAFFNWYFQIDEDETDEGSDENGNYSNEFNFWFNLFWRKGPKLTGANWSDIETEILDTLKLIDQNYDEYIKESNKGFKSESNNIVRKVVRKKAISLLILDEDDEFSEDKSILKQESSSMKYLKKQLFVKNIYDDLRSLEKQFVSFLENSKSFKYVENANQLIAELIIKEFIPRKGFGMACGEKDKFYEKRNDFIKNKSAITQVLSFNYTHETEDEKFVNADVYNNVHGTLEKKDIVFGIDAHEVAKNSLLLPFTKTYRIMANDLDGYRLDSNMKYIKFFGHGLAEADYSYFQTLFDSIDLYHGHTILIFYYTLYDSNWTNEIIEKQRQAVHNLIQRYGETLDNKDHGKNILHKLLMEGRLKVVELSTNFIE